MLLHFIQFNDSRCYYTSYNVITVHPLNIKIGFLGHLGIVNCLIATHTLTIILKSYVHLQSLTDQILLFFSFSQKGRKQNTCLWKTIGDNCCACCFKISFSLYIKYWQHLRLFCSVLYWCSQIFEQHESFFVPWLDILEHVDHIDTGYCKIQLPYPFIHLGFKPCKIFRSDFQLLLITGLALCFEMKINTLSFIVKIHCVAGFQYIQY